MTTAALQQRLRALRTAPPDTGFELRLHNALLREAKLNAGVPLPRQRLVRWWPERKQWRFALLVLALSASATAMLVATAVRRQPAPETVNEAPPVAPTLAAKPKPRVNTHRFEIAPDLPAAPPTSLTIPQRPAMPLSLPRAPSEKPRRELSTINKPLIEEHPARRLEDEHPAQRLEIVREEMPHPALDHLDLPKEVPGSKLEHPGSLPQLRSRPELQLPDQARAAPLERRDNAAKRREKRSDHSRRDNAERGLERAREVRRQHVHQR